MNFEINNLTMGSNMRVINNFIKLSIRKSQYHQAGKGRAILFVLIALISIMAIVFFTVWKKSSDTVLVNPFEPPMMTEARYSKSDVVGDLGGMPVTIPNYFANFVEYEGDPGWEKRVGPVPKRDHHSKLVSFGFEVRFPDMVGLNSDELKEDHQNSTIYNTQWLDVGITTGKNFGDGFGLERRADGEINEKMLKFELQKNKQFGLDVYSPVGVDAATRQPFKVQIDDEDVFIERSTEGRVISLIICSNVSHAAAPCNLRFLLAPDIKAWVNIHFRRGLLSEWRQMQFSVTTLLLSFNVSEGKMYTPSLKRKRGQF